jgi:4-amino-4-deoxy-L-arabinose transferase-like glycosyltransferase
MTALVLGGFAVGTLCSALLYPIINSDSLSYHMPRVFFWFQNQSVARYATPEGRQIFASPFAEYCILQLKILAGGTDRLSNIVQWLAYLLSIMTVSLIARRLGANRHGQQVAAVAAAATAMAILQASTTQNDLVCAFWCLAGVYWIVDYIAERPQDRGGAWWWALWMGSALGLAVLSKPTAYLALAPFLMWLAIVAARRDGLLRTAGLAGVVVLITLVIASGWFVDNARLLDGDVIGFSAPGGNSGLLVADRSPSALVTNALKNSSMMLSTPSDGANRILAAGVRSLIGAYGGDPENPSTMDRNMLDPYALDHRVAYHDVGPSPFTLVLVAAAALVFLLNRKVGNGRERWYLLCAGVALLLTAGLIGYSYYINRILLGALLLLVPMAGVGFDVAERGSRRIAMGLLLAVLGASVVWGTGVMLFNSTNRLVPPAMTPVRIGTRDVGYWNTPYADLSFAEHAPWLERPYKDIADAVRRGGYTRVGIDSKALNVTIWPLLSLLSEQRVAYVGNTLLTGKVKAPGFLPEVIVEITPSDGPTRTAGESTRRGRLLYGPVEAGEIVLRLYGVR